MVVCRSRKIQQLEVERIITDFSEAKARKVTNYHLENILKIFPQLPEKVSKGC